MGTTDTSLYPGSTASSPFTKPNGVNYSRYADITKVTKAQATAGPFLLCFTTFQFLPLLAKHSTAKPDIWRFRGLKIEPPEAI